MSEVTVTTEEQPTSEDKFFGVKTTFEKRHETMAKNMEEVKVSLAEVKSDLKVLVEFIKDAKTK